MTVQTDWPDYDNERLNKPLCQLPVPIISLKCHDLTLRSMYEVQL